MPDLTPAATKTETTTTPIPPVEVAVIGTTGAPPQVVTTPDHLPNLVVTMISPILAILVRFANVYLLTLVGLLGTSMTGALAAPDFWHLVLKCGEMALAPAGLALGKDLITVLSGLEQKFPLATGSV